ncbi:unnamed protein product [Darwinula stevensoni]|uniref:Uncharacterized protein n=1 Tax=Darwinula stevensoni TaxID=69355 RepID=A0A7R8XJ72_9CRUS|nr:unnamed protein product [Darwinula stevensoni]CAG0894551.1 unnamed protein product [Darwinula stevensoni]
MLFESIQDGLYDFPAKEWGWISEEVGRSQRLDPSSLGQGSQPAAVGRGGPSPPVGPEWRS